MEQFLQSMARAFARNQIGIGDVLIAVLVLLGLAAAVWLTARQRNRSARSTQLQRLAELRGLTREDLRCLEMLATGVGVDSLALAAQPELFERATAAVLTDEAALTGESDCTLRIHRIRQALGFDRLAPRAPLLSTRQLSAGAAVELGSNLGEVVATSETAFSVEVRWRPTLSPGQQVKLALAHQGEARYTLRCHLLTVESGPAGSWRLVLAHDEQPARVQQRAYARVVIRTAIVIRPAVEEPEQRVPAREVQGQLIDLSGGGALVAVPTRFTVGERVKVSFAAAGQLFTSLGAVVRSSSDPLRGQSRVQLEFVEVTDHERDRLVAAVMRLELEQRDEKVDLVRKREPAGRARGGHLA